MIDEHNHAVAGIAAPTLPAALHLVGRGRVAAVVGRLRAEVRAIDVDVEGHFGTFVANELAAWLQRRGHWVLIRPSGGSRGRHHLFVALPEADPIVWTGIEDHLAVMRQELKLRHGDLNLRDAIRPLSSPHRTGSLTRPRGDLRTHARSLTRLLPQLPVPAPLPRRKKITARTPAEAAAQHSSGNVVPLFRHTPQRGLSAAWHRYLSTGQPPAGAAYGGHDRSLTEAGLTSELAWAVGDPRTAWQLITESHPRAMTKAKTQGWSWWVKYVWNDAVHDTESLVPAAQQTSPRATTPPDVTVAVAAGRRRLHTLMWTHSPRSRPAILLVGHQLLDRVQRTGSMRVPCPERDLVLDTGIADRKTIRAVLRMLDGPLGILHTDTLSDQDRATTSFEFEIHPSATGVGEIPPPSSHPPRPDRGLWATLPRSCHSLWRALLATHEPQPLDLLIVEAGLIAERTGAIGKHHRAGARTALRLLGQAGLARTDEEGRWMACNQPGVEEIQRRADQTYGEMWTRVVEERVAYRTGTSSAWLQARADAIRRQRAKEKTWWDALPAEQQRERREQRRAHYLTLPLAEQAALKSKLAEGRVVAGATESAVHQTWLESLGPDELAGRSAQRAAWFQTLSPSERGMAVAAWERHRARFGLTQQAAVRPSEWELLPDGIKERDAWFQERQMTLSETVSWSETG